MKIVLIDCSPKKKLSASGFIAGFTSLFVMGEKKKEKLRTKADWSRVLDAVADADNVVFSMPLYVDGVPSHILPFLKEMELRCRENSPDMNVYVIANNGFIEGKQNEPLMQTMEHFCERSGIRWGGGLGIGGGVMMNVMRIMLLVYLALAVFRFVADGIQGSWQAGPWIVFGKQAAVILLLCCGIIAFDIWLACRINQRKEYGKHYTRIMLPSFVFILCADLFFIILSVIQGGIFRGWFSRKKPTRMTN